MKTIDIFDSFATLPLGTWLDILAVNADEGRDEIDKQVGTIALLTGRTERDILHLPLTEYQALARRADFLGQVPERLPRAANSFKAGPFLLCPELDIRKITAAQYVDFRTFAPQGEKALVELLSVALVPKGASYNDGSYDIVEVQDAIRNDITVEQALSLCAFFLTRLAGLIHSTRTSLSRLASKEKNKEKGEAMRQRLAELEATQKRLLQTLGVG